MWKIRGRIRISGDGKDAGAEKDAGRVSESIACVNHFGDALAPGLLAVYSGPQWVNGSRLPSCCSEAPAGALKI